LIISWIKEFAYAYNGMDRLPYELGIDA
jgi:hypothetical protein